YDSLRRRKGGSRLKSAQNGHGVMSSGLLSPYGDHSPSSGVRRPAACRCTQATLPGKAHDLPACAIARPLPCPNNQRRPHAWLCNPVPMLPLEAGMMNPRRLSTVPPPLLRSVILATGVVGLLAAFGPAGIQNTGAASRQDIAPSLSTDQELAVAPQPSSLLNDNSR